MWMDRGLMTPSLQVSVSSVNDPLEQLLLPVLVPSEMTLVPTISAISFAERVLSDR